MPNVLSPRDLVSRPDNMDETVLSSSYWTRHSFIGCLYAFVAITRVYAFVAIPRVRVL